MLRSLSLRLGMNQKHRRRSTRTLSPLQLPEILVIIFSHLADETLRQSVAPVCRLWFQTVQDVIGREVVWYSEWDPTQLTRILSMLPGAERLICHYPFTRLSAERLLIDRLQRLEALYQEQQLNQGSDNNILKQEQYIDQSGAGTGGTQQYRFIFHKHVPLQHMELSISKLSSTSFDQFPFPTSLTTLKLTLCRSFGSSFSLTRILTLCPRLVSFHAKSQNNLGVKVTLEPFEQAFQQQCNTLSPTQLQQHMQQLQQKVFNTPLVLRSLIFESLYLDQFRFKNILAVTPQLKELKLIDMEIGWPSTWGGLLTYIPTLPCKLESTHFSLSNRATDTDEMDTMMALYPMPSEWSLWDLNVQPSLLQSLETTANMVTNLELYMSHGSRGYSADCHGRHMQSAPKLIHKYLCNSPHLIHLRIVRSAFIIEDMDLFGRRTFGDLTLDRGNGSYINPDSVSNSAGAEKSGKLEVWQCRNLKTIQFEINAHLDIVPLSDPVQSRILFGYISRVCPNLEDLDISCPTVCIYGASHKSYTPRLSLGLEGGLCLLSRLRSLRRLKIEEYYLCQSANCEVYEMNWMVPSGRDAWSRKKRQEVMSQWGPMEAEEARLETGRKKDRGPEKLTPFSDAKKDVALAKELQNLGLLVDVKNMVKEMDGGSDRFVCFPELERMSFEYPVENLPRNELHRLFPKNSRLNGTSLIWS